MGRITEISVGVDLGTFHAPVDKLVFRAPLKLVEDAVTGWVNQKIGEEFSVKNPSIADVITFLIHWGPSLLGGLLVALLIILSVRKGRAQKSADMTSSTLGDAEIPHGNQRINDPEIVQIRSDVIR